MVRVNYYGVFLEFVGIGDDIAISYKTNCGFERMGRLKYSKEIINILKSFKKNQKIMLVELFPDKKKGDTVETRYICCIKKYVDDNYISVYQEKSYEEKEYELLNLRKKRGK